MINYIYSSITNDKMWKLSLPGINRDQDSPYILSKIDPIKKGISGIFKAY